MEYIRFRAEYTFDPKRPYMRVSLRALANRSHFSKDAYNCLISSRLIDTQKHTEHHLTYVAKDNIATLREPTTCGSKILENYISPFQATVISLLENSSMALIGKSNMDEFGMGSSTTFSHYGATINPNFSEKRSCGGSSGGSAAAVAAGIVEFALGTDTGGSVRQPASYCGIVGFKPSYGRISRYGVVAYAQALDCVGIFSCKLPTINRIYDILNHHDEKDITSMPNEIRKNIKEELRKRSKCERLRIGVPQEFLLAETYPQTRKSLEQVLQKLMGLGHIIVPVSIPSIEKLVSAYYTLVSAEAASNLSRFDGKAFGGFGSDHALLQHEAHETSGVALIHNNRTEGLGPEVKRRVLLGNYTLSSASGDNFFKATQLRKKIVEEFNDVFSFPNFMIHDKRSASEQDALNCHVLIGPTVFGEAPTLEECDRWKDRGSVDEYLNDVFTIPASLAALPAISIPSQNPNIGVQIIGQYGDDEMVLKVAELIARHEG